MLESLRKTAWRRYESWGDGTGDEYFVLDDVFILVSHHDGDASRRTLRLLRNIRILWTAEDRVVLLPK